MKMPKTLGFLDTNILARFIMQDDENSKHQVKQIFDLAVEKEGVYLISETVLVELNYVLSHHYGIPKDKIILAFRKLLDLGFVVMAGVIQNVDFVLKTYEANNKLSLEDCIYLRTCKENGWELITFDKKLKKEFEKVAL